MRHMDIQRVQAGRVQAGRAQAGRAQAGRVQAGSVQAGWSQAGGKSGQNCVTFVKNGPGTPAGSLVTRRTLLQDRKNPYR